MNQSESIPKPVRIFLITALVLDLVGIVCEAVARYWLHLGFPYNSPVVNEAWFVDLTNYARLFPYVHSPRFFDTVRGIGYEYPAPVAPLYGFFLHLPTAVFGSILIASMIAVALAFGVHLRSRGLSAGSSAWIAGGALLLSYPAAFELRQGNMEFFVCVVTGLGIWSLVRGRFKAAAILIGIAGAMKMYPYLYLGVFLAERRYRALGIAVISATIVTVASLWYLDPSLSVAWRGVQHGLGTYMRTVSPAIVPQTSYDHSLFVPIKLLLRAAHPQHWIVASVRSVKIYLAIVVIGGIVLFFTRIQRLPVINQILCLCVVPLLLLPNSYDYTLLNLYIPWAMLVCFAISIGSVPTPGLRPAFICLAVATSIETEFILWGYSLGGLFKTCALCILMVLALRYPFQQRQQYL